MILNVIYDIKMLLELDLYLRHIYSYCLNQHLFSCVIKNRSHYNGKANAWRSADGKVAQISVNKDRTSPFVFLHDFFF